MKITITLLTIVIAASTAYSQNKQSTTMKGEPVVCKLTTPELQQRKKTVIAELKGLLLERVETTKGVKYKFENSDKMIDLATDFIKTERLCCSFFDFDLHVSADDGFMWLELSGPEGTKQFIKDEIDF